MKKYKKIIGCFLLLLIFLSFFALPQDVLAEEPDKEPDKANPFLQFAKGGAKIIVGVGTGGLLSPWTISGLSDTAEGGASAGGGVVKDWLIKQLEILIVFFIEMLGLTILLVAYLFDTSILVSISHFSQWAVSPAVRAGWTTIRDLANIFFIFILLYISIGMILRLSFVDPRKMVIKVVIVALLINFSAVIARTIIDSGNILSLYFYESIKGENDGIGWSIMQQARLASSLKFYEAFGVAKKESSLPGSYLTGSDKEAFADAAVVATSEVAGKFVSGLGVIVFLIVTIILLVAATIFFIGRTVVLLFLIMTAPFAFFFHAFPVGGGLSRKWWDNLWKQVFFAPFFLILFYIALKVAGDFSTITVTSGIPFGEVVKTVLNFTLTIGMLAAALIVAKNLGGTVANFAVNKGLLVGKGIGKGIGMGALGATRFGARNTVGKGAFMLGNAKWARDAAARMPGGGLLMKGIDKVGGGYEEAYKKSKKEAEKTAQRLATDRRTGAVDVDIMEEYQKRRGAVPFTKGEKKLPGWFATAGVDSAKPIEKVITQTKIKEDYDWKQDEKTGKWRWETGEEKAKREDENKEQIKALKEMKYQLLADLKKQRADLLKELSEKEVTEPSNILGADGTPMVATRSVDATEVKRRRKQFNELSRDIRNLQRDLGVEETMKVKSEDNK